MLNFIKKKLMSRSRRSDCNYCNKYGWKGTDSKINDIIKNNGGLAIIGTEDMTREELITIAWKIW